MTCSVRSRRRACEAAAATSTSNRGRCCQRRTRWPTEPKGQSGKERWERKAQVSSVWAWNGGVDEIIPLAGGLFTVHPRTRASAFIVRVYSAGGTASSSSRHGVGGGSFGRRGTRSGRPNDFRLSRHFFWQSTVWTKTISRDDETWEKVGTTTCELPGGRRTFSFFFCSMLYISHMNEGYKKRATRGCEFLHPKNDTTDRARLLYR
ncbi:hypothetical protein LZ30DRAFT_304862 [Colletotrichum cereale]|nr:hypothetical protein LZ30DRAFT_304862 [Colletotrichum cereale]